MCGSSVLVTQLLLLPASRFPQPDENRPVHVPEFEWKYGLVGDGQRATSFRNVAKLERMGGY